jgi:lipopolysaccharide export system protein LptC
MTKRVVVILALIIVALVGYSMLKGQKPSVNPNPTKD